MLSKGESVVISFLRVMAMLLIIACHFAQGLGDSVAYLLNVGVQVFFLLSGFLYGVLPERNAFAFYKGRLLKVYVPFVLFVWCVLLLFSIFQIAEISCHNWLVYTFNIQAFFQAVPGLNHLWFLSIIMLCYVITPPTKCACSRWPVACFVLFLLLALLVFVVIQKMYTYSAYVFLYLFGLFWGQCRKTRWTVLVGGVSLLVILVLTCVYGWSLLTDASLAHVSVWYHCLLATAILAFSLSFLSSFFEFAIDIKLLKWCDSISFELYLVHHVLILGPCSLLFLTKHTIVNVMIILTVSVIISYFFSLFVRYLQRFLKSSL